GKGGTIGITTDKISVNAGTFNLSALGATDSGIGISTGPTGILTNGNGISVQTDGTMQLSLINNTINADSATGDGGTIVLRAAAIINTNGSLATPLILTANGSNNGNGGNITYIDSESVPTFIGQPAKAPKGAANFLTLSAHAGATDGNGGVAFVQVG